MLIFPKGGMDMAETQIVFVAHGSRDPQWADSLVDALMDVRSCTSQPVHIAYLSHQNPSLHQVAGEAAAAGVTELLVLPLLLSGLGHMDRDLKGLVESISDELAIHLKLLPAMGETPEFREMLKAIVRRVGNS